MKRKPAIRRGRRKRNNSANAKRVLNTDFEEEKDLSSITGQSKSTMEHNHDKKVGDKDEVEASLASPVDGIKRYASSSSTSTMEHNQEIKLGDKDEVEASPSSS
eukprot:2686368-Ditylum_brightwellii.AAC.1